MTRPGMHDDTPIDEELRALLERMPAPAPAPGFYERAIERAVAGRERQRELRKSRTRWLLAGAGSAIAAGMAALLIATVLFDAQLPLPGNDAPSVSMSLAEPHTVNLVFAAAEPLEQARLTLLLPDGIELAGFPGQREIRWDTSLAAGRNLLPLTLVAVGGTGGTIVAHLEHAARDRTFTLHVDVG